MEPCRTFVKLYTVRAVVKESSCEEPSRGQHSMINVPVQGRMFVFIVCVWGTTVQQGGSRRILGLSFSCTFVIFSIPTLSLIG